MNCHINISQMIALVGTWRYLQYLCGQQWRHHTYHRVDWAETETETLIRQPTESRALIVKLLHTDIYISRNNGTSPTNQSVSHQIQSPTQSPLFTIAYKILDQIVKWDCVCAIVEDRLFLTSFIHSSTTSSCPVAATLWSELSNV